MLQIINYHFTFFSLMLLLCLPSKQVKKEKYIKNATRCKDSRVTKETRLGYQHKTVQFTIPPHNIHFHTCIMEKMSVGGLYAVIPTSFPIT